MTRIIAGEFRGRRLTVPKGQNVRPTTDRMRERVFSMLQHERYPDLVGARVADIFAGTGALGLEALSRGAEHVVFVEKSPQSLQYLSDNIQTLNAETRTTIVKRKATDIPETDKAFDLIFMDPPYGRGLLAPSLTKCIGSGWSKAGTVFICELGSDEAFEIPEGFSVMDDRSQGAQRMLFLEAL